MDIYIKSFNRAYLLHRTIASIYQFLIGFDGKIVVLDDGTPQKFLNKIQELFPEIFIVKSPDYNQKTKNILARIETQNIIPATFWRDEVLKGSDHFILLEDDMWFSKPINYKEFTTEVEHNNLDMTKFMWLRNPKLISTNIINKSKYFYIVQPKVLTENDFLFNALFRTNNWRLGSLSKKVINHNEELLKYYHLYSVAGAVFSKKYYKNTWKDHKNKVDELYNISAVLKNIRSYRFAHSTTEIIKTTLKFKATNTSKKNDTERFDVFEFNYKLNEYWYNNHREPINFNDDISDEWICKFCEHNNISFKSWQNWYSNIKKSYELLGCSID